MEGIVQALGSFFGNGAGGANWGNILKAGTVGAGGGFDLFSDIRNLQGLNRIRNYENNPASAAAWIAKATQPLSLSLKQNVGNATQGYLAERGLATSPNIAAATEAQAIAPYELQNQNQATQMFLSMLQPQKYPQVDLGSLMKLFKPTPSVEGRDPYADMYPMHTNPGQGTPSLFDWNPNTPTTTPDFSSTLDSGS